MFVFLLCLLCGAMWVVQGEDPYFFFTWRVTYGVISPLGVPQQGILINDQFPGPNINSTSNNNLVINVFNHLDEPLLFTWYVPRLAIAPSSCMQYIVLFFYDDYFNKIFLNYWQSLFMPSYLSEMLASNSNTCSLTYSF